MGEKQKMKTQKETTSCDMCANYSYDEEYGYYICEADLDEDDMARFLSSARFECPYYQSGDEYRIVRKQI